MKREVLDHEYDQIITYLQSVGVNEERLQAEMADHLIIITEMHMNSGQDFDAAFEKAKKEIRQKDLLEINGNKGSFSTYPKFLGKPFLKTLASIALLIFLTGLFMKYDHVPRHRMVIIIGRRLFGYVFLPMLLLYNLTEYANKTKQVLEFMFQFVCFYMLTNFLIHRKVNLISLLITIILGTLWIILYFIIPKMNSKKRIN